MCELVINSCDGKKKNAAEGSGEYLVGAGFAVSCGVDKDGHGKMVVSEWCLTQRGGSCADVWEESPGGREKDRCHDLGLGVRLACPYPRKGVGEWAR